MLLLLYNYGVFVLMVDWQGHPRLVNALAKLYSPLHGREIDPMNEVLYCYVHVRSQPVHFNMVQNRPLLTKPAVCVVTQYLRSEV